MTRLLSRYLSVTILRYYAALATVAVVVASLIEFLENRDGLMDEPNLTVLDAIRFSLLSAPGIFTLLAGFIALVAVLVACIALLRHSELKVMLAAGLTYGQLLLAVLPAALLMGGIHFGVENLVLPRTTSALHAWGIGNAGRQPGEPEGIWVRQGDHILSVGTLDQRDQTLHDVRLFALTRSGHLEWHASGPSARFEPGALVFPEASQGVVGEPRTGIARYLRIATPLDFPLLSALSLKPRQTSVWNIARVMEQKAAGAYPRHVYELWFHKKLAGPLATVLAVLLLAPLMQHVHRLGTATLLVAGLAAGFLCFVADAVLTGMGEAGFLQPVAAAWAVAGLLAAVIAAPLLAAAPGPRD